MTNYSNRRVIYLGQDMIIKLSATPGYYYLYDGEELIHYRFEDIDTLITEGKLKIMTSIKEIIIRGLNK